MSTNREIVDKFYLGVSTGNAEMVAGLLDDRMELVVPVGRGVLSGHYKGKQRFMTEVLPLVFSCTNPGEIVFCKDHQIMAEDGETVVAIARNDGLAASGARYDQVYAHIMTVRDGKILRLIEFFDSALAERALWGSSPDLPPDAAFNMSDINSADATPNADTTAATG